MKVSKQILDLIPYKPGKPISETQREFGLSHVIKLASNENSLGPSPKAVEAIKKHLQELHRYPDPMGFDLVSKVSNLWKVPTQNISIGNGSNEIIDILIRIYCEPGEKIITTQYGFVAYQICAQAARVETEFVPVKKDFSIDLEKMAEHLENDIDHKIRIAFIPNPNNPTGTYSTQNQIEKFLARVGQREDLLIVFDEAYTEFVRAVDYKPAVAFCEKYPTVVVMRTMSKVYGLAGLRLGVLVADTSVVDLYNRIRNPFNTNELAQVATVAALDDIDFIKASQKLVWEGLDYFYKSFNEMGLPFIPSQGNFVLVEMPKPAAEIYNALLRKGIILRPVGNYGLPNHLRITVGLPEENEAAIKALKEVLKN